MASFTCPYCRTLMEERCQECGFERKYSFDRTPEWVRVDKVVAKKYAGEKPPAFPRPKI